MTSVTVRGRPSRCGHNVGAPRSRPWRRLAAGRHTTPRGRYLAQSGVRVIGTRGVKVPAAEVGQASAPDRLPRLCPECALGIGEVAVIEAEGAGQPGTKPRSALLRLSVVLRLRPSEWSRSWSPKLVSTPVARPGTIPRSGSSRAMPGADPEPGADIIIGSATTAETMMATADGRLRTGVACGARVFTVTPIVPRGRFLPILSRAIAFSLHRRASSRSPLRAAAKAAALVLVPGMASSRPARLRCGNSRADATPVRSCLPWMPGSAGPRECRSSTPREHLSRLIVDRPYIVPA